MIKTAAADQNAEQQIGEAQEVVRQCFRELRQEIDQREEMVMAEVLYSLGRGSCLVLVEGGGSIYSAASAARKIQPGGHTQHHRCHSPLVACSGR